MSESSKIEIIKKYAPISFLLIKINEKASDDPTVYYITSRIWSLFDKLSVILLTKHNDFFQVC